MCCIRACVLSVFKSVHQVTEVRKAGSHIRIPLPLALEWSTIWMWWTTISTGLSLHIHQLLILLSCHFILTYILLSLVMFVVGSSIINIFICFFFHLSFLSTPFQTRAWPMRCVCLRQKIFIGGVCAQTWCSHRSKFDELRKWWAIELALSIYKIIWREKSVYNLNKRISLLSLHFVFVSLSLSVRTGKRHLAIAAVTQAQTYTHTHNNFTINFQNFELVSFVERNEDKKQKKLASETIHWPRSTSATAQHTTPQTVYRVVL